VVVVLEVFTKKPPVPLSLQWCGTSPQEIIAMKVITPQFVDLADLDGAELDQYLADERLVVKKCKLPNVGVAFPMEMLPMIEDVIDGKITSVTSQNFGQLANDVENAEKSKGSGLLNGFRPRGIRGRGPFWER
jgi:hypothetical protein